MDIIEINASEDSIDSDDLKKYEYDARLKVSKEMIN